MFEFIANNLIARLTLLALVFGIVVYAAIRVAEAIARRSAVREDLREMLGASGLVTGRTRLTETKDGAWNRLADQIEKIGLSLADTRGDDLRRKLIAAGYASTAAPRIFTLVRFLMVFLLPGAFILFSSLVGQQLTFTRLYLYGGILALLGLYLPNLYVTARADRRRETINNGFPDCLDLILVCVEAGLGLEAALDRVGREMVTSHPLVAQLLSNVTLQLRAGAERGDALRRMGEMSGVDEIKSFATMLIQSDKLGTSLSDTLRVYAAEMREKRRLRAEEKAHRIPVLISIPLVVCMLPTMIGVLMVPGAVRIVRLLIPTLTGG